MKTIEEAEFLLRWVVDVVNGDVLGDDLCDRIDNFINGEENK